MYAFSIFTRVIAFYIPTQTNEEPKMERIISDYERKNDLRCNIVLSYSGKELLSKITENGLLFLDIDMPNEDGIETGKRVIEQGWRGKVAMLTSQTHRYKEAFKINAFRFVTKPIDPTEVFEAIDSYRRKKIGERSIEIYTNGQKIELKANKLKYIESCRDFIRIHAEKGSIDSWISMKEFSKQLDQELFVQSHKKYIVNLGYIRDIPQNEIVLKDGFKIPVSRRRKRDVLLAYVNYDTEIQ